MTVESAVKPVAKHNTNGVSANNSILEIENLSVLYSEKTAVDNVSLSLQQQRVTAIIGSSGCGKSTLLRTLNRMNDFIPEVSLKGQVYFKNVDIYGDSIDPVEVRRCIGMVFQRPNPFPKSIYKNISWGPSINGYNINIDYLVESSLKKAALWDEVKDRLNESALKLSGGQQQRLCIARTLAMQPEVILMDEPCSALDPASTAKIEDLLFELKKKYCIVIVTHNMQQASRASDFTAFMDDGRLVEFGETEQVFTNPKEKRCEDYVTGRFG